MFKHLFDNIAGVEIFPIMALMLFFTFFVGLMIWVFRLDNRFIKKMRNLPLESNTGEDAS